MKKRSRFRTEAWLLRGIHSMPGALVFAQGRLSFKASGSGTFSRRQLRRLEEESGRAGLAASLENDEHAVVFDVPLSDVQHVSFPWYYFSGGVKFSLQGIRYRFGFDKPANTRLPSESLDLRGVSKARRNGKAWKALLLD